MCMSHKTRCVCGANSAELTMRDEILAPAVVDRLYCPECARGLEVDGSRMLVDNGWVIEFDIDTAGLYSRKMTRPPDPLTPEYIFDEGYCTWAGYCPGDIEQAATERAEIVKIMKVDPRAYIEELKSWGMERATRLGDEGWRKAKAAV